MAEGGGDEDKSSKTEEPTQHRLDEAEKKGQIVYSREVNNFFVFFALALMIAWALPGSMRGVLQDMAPFLTDPQDFDISINSLQSLMGKVGLSMLNALLIPLGLIIILVLGAAGIQSKFLFAVERIKPKWEKVSPVKGLKRMFSLRSIVEFLKGMIKISIITIISVMVVKDDIPRFENLPNFNISDVLALLSSLALEILIGVCCAMFLIAIIDYIYQRFEFMKSMRMSKQEIKEEHKQQEGDPHIKGKLRQIRMERARKRMMAAVPTSDVVITNPTHFAVALKYETGTMRAPVVVAKGADEVAFRIREVAKEHEVPIVENPPLARILFAEAEVDDEIPYEHYKAVAEVIGYVYRLKGKLK